MNVTFVVEFWDRAEIRESTVDTVLVPRVGDLFVLNHVRFKAEEVVICYQDHNGVPGDSVIVYGKVDDRRHRNETLKSANDNEA
jgi:hypothetical protein